MLKEVEFLREIYALKSRSTGDLNLHRNREESTAHLLLYGCFNLHRNRGVRLPLMLYDLH